MSGWFGVTGWFGWSLALLRRRRLNLGGLRRDADMDSATIVYALAGVVAAGFQGRDKKLICFLDHLALQRVVRRAVEILE